MPFRERLLGLRPHRGSTSGAVAETAVVDVMLPASRLAPKQARDALSELAPQVPAAMLEDARLLVSELVTNSVSHAASGRDARIRFRAESRPGRLRVEVTDWGPGFDAAVAERPLDDEPGGFGLYLVRRLATRWGVERRRTTLVWFELDEPEPEPRSAELRRRATGPRPSVEPTR